MICRPNTICDRWHFTVSKRSRQASFWMGRAGADGVLSLPTNGHSYGYGQKWPARHVAALSAHCDSQCCATKSLPLAPQQSPARLRSHACLQYHFREPRLTANTSPRWMTPSPVAFQLVHVLWACFLLWLRGPKKISVSVVIVWRNAQNKIMLQELVNLHPFKSAWKRVKQVQFVLTDNYGFWWPDLPCCGGSPFTFFNQLVSCHCATLCEYPSVQMSLSSSKFPLCSLI